MGQMSQDPDFANWERPVDAPPSPPSKKSKRRKASSN